MPVDALTGLLGVLVALTGALVRLTWTLSSRLARLEVELSELTRRIAHMEDGRAKVDAIAERLAVLEAEHERAWGPGGACRVRAEGKR